MIIHKPLFFIKWESYMLKFSEIKMKNQLYFTAEMSHIVPTVCYFQNHSNFSEEHLFTQIV
jgi:hypothetical protein